MRTFNTKRKAFTLIELLIVIAIIGILFIVLISKVDFASDKAKATGVQTDFRSFQVAIESVAKEHAGLATFGWDTGDTNGDRIRNSYDKGDTNKNGKQDDGEVFVGSKTYGETWTNIYTLTNPSDADDKSAIAALEAAINANLDPKLHITIHDNLTITMANGAQDPWNTEYHGYYITNATVDGKDRGAIVIYSNGANQEFGSEHSIAGGIVTVNVPGNNVYGKDDYGMSVIYTYVNGYGEIKTTTSGFSVNQGGGQAGTDGTFIPGNGGSNDDEPGNGNVDEPDEPTVVLPVAKSDLTDYTWEEIKQLADANLTPEEYKNNYGIEVGDYKETNGVKYVLVDLGCDDDGDGKRDNYAGFVFMYDSGTSNVINDPAYSVGGYVASEMKLYVDDGDDTNNVDLYDKLDPSIKPLLKKVTITCNDGGANPTATHEYTAHMFLASVREVGFDVSGWTKPDGYMAEGTCFDLFTTADSSRTGFMSKANISSYWWLRSANTAYDQTFWAVYTSGVSTISGSQGEAMVVPAFVIGGPAPSVVVPNSPSPIAYSWSELKTLAAANLGADELRDTYGIEVGDYKEVDGVKYILVDLGTDNDGDGIREAGEDYDGFVFMYNSGTESKLNSTYTNQGGYASTDVGKAYVDSLYTNLTDADLKNSIKKVTIICNSGDLAANGGDTNGMSKYITDAYMFLASTKEIGCNLSGYQYDAEGSVFDYFAAGTDTVRKDFGTLVNIPGYSAWWLRSANSDGIQDFHGVYCTWGNCGGGTASFASVIVPVFVIGEQIPIEVVPTPEPDPEPTPEPELTPEPITYSWSELKTLAQKNLSADELRDTYGIEVGDYKEVDGVKYILVDLDGNDYDGFVFMYNSGTKSKLNSTSTNQGGYASTDIGKAYVDSLYTNLADADLKNSIKEVTITCNDGADNRNETHEYTTHMFLASYREVGYTSMLNSTMYGPGLSAEGKCFDLFTDDNSSRTTFMSMANISDRWWLRSAFAGSTTYFCNVSKSGSYDNFFADSTYVIVPAFVIG